MRKIFVISVSAILFFTACENTGSSTVGTYDTTETSASENAEHPYTDTSKTNGELSTKKDTSATTDKKVEKTESTTKSASKP